MIDVSLLGGSDAKASQGTNVGHPSASVGVPKYAFIKELIKVALLTTMTDLES